MYQLIAGVAVFLLTIVTFWYCLPRGGQTHRLVGTEWEPYVGLAFCAAVALACTMMLSGAINVVTAWRAEKPKAGIETIDRLAQTVGYEVPRRG